MVLEARFSPTSPPLLHVPVELEHSLLPVA